MREHDLGAVDVRLDRPHRRLDDQLHADGGREVEDDIGAIDELGRERLVHHRVDHVFEAGWPFRCDDVVHRAGGEIVDDDDLMARASSASARWEPTNPAPPVRSAFIGHLSVRDSSARAGVRRSSFASGGDDHVDVDAVDAVRHVAAAAFRRQPHLAARAAGQIDAQHPLRGPSGP